MIRPEVDALTDVEPVIRFMDPPPDRQLLRAGVLTAATVQAIPGTALCNGRIVFHPGHAGIIELIERV